MKQPPPPTKNLILRNFTESVIVIKILKDDKIVVDILVLKPLSLTHWRKVTSSELSLYFLCGNVVVKHSVNFDCTAVIELSCKTDESDGIKIVNFEHSQTSIRKLIATAPTDFGKNNGENEYLESGHSNPKTISNEITYILNIPYKIYDFASNSQTEIIKNRLNNTKKITNRSNKLFEFSGIKIVSSKYLLPIDNNCRILADQNPLDYLIRFLDSGLHKSGINEYSCSRPDIDTDPRHIFDLPIFLLGNFLIGTYGHWLLDLMPRIAAYRSIVDETIVLILVPDDTPGYVYECLNLFKINPNLIVKFSDISPFNLPLTCKKLYFSSSPTMLDPGGGISKHSRDFFYNELYHLYEQPALNNKPKRVFVGRRGDTRNILNSSSVYDIFSKYGFTIVYNEDLTLEEKIRLYSKTRILAGPIGSNLSVSVFMPPGGYIIEIVGDRYSIETRSLASAFDHNYISIIGKSEETPLAHNANIYVDELLLDHALSNLFSSVD